MAEWPISQSVSTEIGGKTYTGTFQERAGMITVSYGGFSDTTQTSPAPLGVARIILGELVRKSLQHPSED